MSKISLCGFLLRNYQQFLLHHRDIAEIAYFASRPTLREGATLWFNAQPIPATHNTLAIVTAWFLAHFVFDEANKWRYLGEYFKTKQIPTESCDDFITRV